MFLTLYLCLVPNHFINQIIATPSLIHPYPSVPRIGQIVILHVGDSAACALVHTVWPVGRKSRPCVQKVLLERVKVFRATILQRTAREGQLVPTEDTWLHRPEHVLAILDVASQDFHAGFFTLTEASTEAFECLLTSEVGVRDDEKTKARKARSSKVSFQKTLPSAYIKQPPLDPGKVNVMQIQFHRMTFAEVSPARMPSKNLL